MDFYFLPLHNILAYWALFGRQSHRVLPNKAGADDLEELNLTGLDTDLHIASELWRVTIHLKHISMNIIINGSNELLI
ncbi:hypothetical protein NQ314_015308 [Rhamnusium bicolor]|uniref:Uncharacterized protein n=1 Tax=Rhamnusium bicolor TaxID=1586634 RepID=A0AAV8WZV3_9CUCU|nr:hypothetical protein NQ314_015308 [Rhamnusium bicolor]